MVRQVVSSLLLASSLILMAACTAGGGGGGGGDGAAEGGDDGAIDGEDGGTGAGSCLAPDGSALPEVPQGSLTAGTLVLSVPENIDPASIKAQVVNQPDLKLKQASDCRFFIEGIPEGSHDVVLTANTLNVATLTVQEQAFERAVYISDLAVKKNEVVDGGKTDIPVAGTIIGKVKKHGQSNHLGIDVFVPGVSGFLVKTAADGSFSLKAPVGTVPVAFKADSYRTVVRHFEIKSGAELDIGEIVLAVGTLGANQVLINNGDEASSSLTVTVQVGATEDAIRMKVSETKDFAGKSWQELKPVFTYTFADYPASIGQTENQICVAIENEDGSEVSSCDTIFLDPFATGGKLFTPSFDVPNKVKASDGKITLTIDVVPKAARR